MLGMVFHMPVSAYAVSVVDTDQCMASPKHHYERPFPIRNTYPFDHGATVGRCPLTRESPVASRAFLCGFFSFHMFLLILIGFFMRDVNQI